MVWEDFSIFARGAVFAPPHPLARLTGSSTAMERFDFDFWFWFWFNFDLYFLFWFDFWFWFCLCTTSPTGNTKRVLYCYEQVWFLIFDSDFYFFIFYFLFWCCTTSPIGKTNRVLYCYGEVPSKSASALSASVSTSVSASASTHPPERLTGSSSAMGRCHTHHSKLASTSIVHNIW